MKASIRPRLLSSSLVGRGPPLGCSKCIQLAIYLLKLPALDTQALDGVGGLAGKEQDAAMPLHYSSAALSLRVKAQVLFCTHRAEQYGIWDLTRWTARPC